MPPSEHPASVLLLEFDLPTFLSGHPTPEQPAVPRARIVARRTQVERLVESHGVTALKLPLPDRVLYARFLAKIGYAFAVGTVGVDGFSQVFVRDAILGRSQDVARWVGCVPQEQRSRGEGLHEAFCLLNDDLIQVGIRLFSMWENSPEYRVVVGRVKDPGSL